MIIATATPMKPSMEAVYHPPPTAPGMTMTGVPVGTGPAAANYYVPSALQIHSPAPGPWSTGLCHCYDDCSNCCMTLFCPCITFGQIAEIVDRGSTSCGASGALYTLICCFTGCQCFYSFFYRKKMRHQYGLHKSPCNDCLVHCCCEPCALCQEYRELKRRGFDMHIGWLANMDRQGGGAVGIVPPPIPGGMTR